MIYCVSRTYSKTNDTLHHKNSSLSTINSKPPETNNNSIHDLYVSNNMMLSMLTVSGQDSNNQSQITSNTQKEDSQFYSYRQQLQKQLSERKIKRNYEQAPKTRENNSRQSICTPQQSEPQESQRQSSRTVPNLFKTSQLYTQNQKQLNPLLLNSSSNEISFGQYKFKKNEILQDVNSISNAPEDDAQIHLPMKFQPFQFKQ
ncbi:unnamed protein product (macronuclear) [Paramecium tetraurelia]|uniref:Uncharacterized protein n=1 Tax=Paramecium tetraurelia TaxID=5888 RepID=A0DTX3_PARTE|nr:uncharacterized protein GSPATT00020173001 [Paramecium tetraurelia]CAK86490.1 unnamed protein product [Paramecium tetraurelia]|eukprot:XP_001453887.1 hypothetical protein (macronuclear) [Paramecium tetraurelia strain d4-2]